MIDAPREMAFLLTLHLVHISGSTVQPPNNGHFGRALFVLCREVALFGRFKMYYNYKDNYFGNSGHGLCREVYYTVS